jgi:hypothetical protein
MLCMFFSHILETKIIHHTGELYGVCDMAPQTWRELGLVVAMDSYAPGKELVRENAGLGGPMYAFLYLNVNVSI